MNDRLYMAPKDRGLLQRSCGCGCRSGCGAKDEKTRGYQPQRRATGPTAASTPPAIVHEVLNAPGQPLDRSTRTLMESRFGHSFGHLSVHRIGAQLSSKPLAMGEPEDRFEQEADRMSDLVMRSQEIASGPGYDFSQIRVHTDARATESARAVNALAYTVGNHIVFGSGQHAPGTVSGRRLLAHELTHVIQQSAQHPGSRLMRKWDDAPDCAKQPKDKWIKTVTVNQEGSQTATVEWSDGSTESDQCSAGKGHCCVDDSNASGIACTIDGSHVTGSNCTPMTQKKGYPVESRVLDHDGVAFWTEFVPSPRSIALHEYSPIDGTPLSHGCVRLHTEMAKKIFCGVRRNDTWVKVLGFARPKCDNTTLQKEWLNDFRTAGTAKPDGVITAGEIAETRHEMESAFGRKLKVEDYKKLTAADIPRCKSSAPLPKPAATPVSKP